jgi:hypothetical protein
MKNTLLLMLLSVHLSGQGIDIPPSSADRLWIFMTDRGVSCELGDSVAIGIKVSVTDDFTVVSVHNLTLDEDRFERLAEMIGDSIMLIGQRTYQAEGKRRILDVFTLQFPQCDGTYWSMGITNLSYARRQIGRHLKNKKR